MECSRRFSPPRHFTTLTPRSTTTSTRACIFLCFHLPHLHNPSYLTFFLYFMSILLRALCAVKEKKPSFRGINKQSSSDSLLNQCSTNSSNSLATTPNSSFSSQPPAAVIPSYSAEIPALNSASPYNQLSSVTCNRLLRTLDEFDEEVMHFDPYHGGKAPVLAQHDMHLLALVYNHMLHQYDRPRYTERDNDGRAGSSATVPAAGSHVPNYFANVQDQSIHRRKVLSMAGLRNLVIVGSDVFDELREHLFSSDPSCYMDAKFGGSGSEGVHKMRFYTGNMVDLDTTVLRANDRITLNTVNEMNKKVGGTVYADCKEFGNSKQATHIAKAAAGELLKRFCTELDLTKSEGRKRRADICDVPSTIPIARSNSDRGKHPIWRYCNAGQDSFHVNVPCVEDIVGALLRAPFKAAQIYLRIWINNEGEERDAHLDRFFSDCIADACFNQKWKAVEEFARAEGVKGSIVSLLQELQQTHQQQFMDIMDDDDENYTKEKDLMLRLVAGKYGKK